MDYTIEHLERAIERLVEHSRQLSREKALLSQDLVSLRAQMEQERYRFQAELGAARQNYEQQVLKLEGNVKLISERLGEQNSRYKAALTKAASEVTSLLDRLPAARENER